MVGEPDLQSSNQATWPRLIAECVCAGKPLPCHLAKDGTVGALEMISSLFDDICLVCSQFDVRPGENPKPRRKFLGLRKGNHPGCINNATVHVCISTTASKEMDLCADIDVTNLCCFHQKSEQSRNLLLTAGLETSRQAIYVTAADESAQILDRTDGAAPCTENRRTIAIPEVDSSSRNEDSKPLHTAHVDTLESASRDRNNTDPNTPSLGILPARASPRQAVDVNDPLSVPVVNFSRRDPPPDTNLMQNDAENQGGLLEERAQPSTHVPIARRRRKRKVAISSTLPPRCQRFTARSKELDAISRHFFEPISSGSKSTIKAKTLRTVCLYGPIGVGKTQLALEFCSRSIKNYDAIIWINGSTMASLGRSFHDCAVILGLAEDRVDRDHTQSRTRVTQWLITTPMRWLMVLDDINEHHFDETMMRLSPKSEGCVLTTSHRRLSSENDVPHILDMELRPFDSETAMVFLRTHLPDGFVPQSQRSIARMAKQYFASPMVLNHIVDWSCRERMSIRTISDHLDGRHVILNFGQGNVNPVILASEERLSESCRCVLQTMSLLDPERIPHRMLLDSQEIHCCGRQSAESVVQSALHELWRNALCEIDASGMYSRIHPAIATCVQMNMSDEALDMALDRTSRYISLQWPPRHKLRNIIDGFWPEFQHLHSHVHHTANVCLQSTSRRVFPDSSSLRQLLFLHSWSVFIVLTRCIGIDAEQAQCPIWQL